MDGVYPKLAGQEQPTLIAVDMGSGQPLALGAIPEKDWRAVVKWLQPLVAAWGVEVLVTDDLKEFAVAAERLQLSHQVCHFHLLRWLWHALEKLRKKLDEEQHELLDEIWRIMKKRPPDGRMRLFELWQGIEVRRLRHEQTSALYRLRLLILRLHETWPKYILDPRRGQMHKMVSEKIGRIEGIQSSESFIEMKSRAKAMPYKSLKDSD